MELEKWRNEVYDYSNSLLQEILKNEDAKELCYGFYAIDRPIIMNPEILFLGINPGKGDGTRNYQVQIETGDENSYLDNYYEFKLRNNARELIGSVYGYSESEVSQFLRTKVVKSNLYYVTTSNVADLKKCMNSLGSKRFDKYFGKSCEFTAQLIKITKPTVVIIEGKSAFSNLIEDYFDVGKCWYKGSDIGFYNDEAAGVGYVGYKRDIGNRLVSDKTEIVRFLKESLKIN